MEISLQCRENSELLTALTFLCVIVNNETFYKHLLNVEFMATKYFLHLSTGIYSLYIHDRITFLVSANELSI